MRTMPLLSGKAARAVNQVYRYRHCQTKVPEPAGTAEHPDTLYIYIATTAGGCSEKHEDPAPVEQTRELRHTVLRNGWLGFELNCKIKFEVT